MLGDWNLKENLRFQRRTETLEYLKLSLVQWCWCYKKNGKTMCLGYL